jgi:tRNA threonylcarbamoyladenosine biosynthesis protein TsaB
MHSASFINNKNVEIVINYMINFLGIQSTYQTVDLAIFSDTHLREMQSIHKNQASALLIPTLDTLLKKHECALNNLNFIAVNQGPSPFTTLRVVISSANGISFATKIPLIGVDAFDAFLDEQSNQKFPNTVILLNAFNKDVYFCIQKQQTVIHKGYKNIFKLLEELKKIFTHQTIRFIGNGATLYKKDIGMLLENQAYIPQLNPQTCAIKYVGLHGLTKWNKQEGITTQLLPLYFKQALSG